MNNTDLYLVRHWAKMGFFIFAFPRGTTHDWAFASILATLEELDILRDYHRFCLHGFELESGQHDKVIKSQQFRDEEITVTWVPLRVEDTGQVQHLYIDAGATHAWQFGKVHPSIRKGGDDGEEAKTDNA